MPSQIVVVLDDDPSVLKSLSRLLTDHGYQVRSHSSAEDFLGVEPPRGPACLLLDQSLGSTTGLVVHAEMRRRGWNLPTIFLTAHAETASVVSAIRGGADDFITKPYDPAELMAATTRAMEHATQLLSDNESKSAIQAGAARLTDRERTIVSLVLGGLLNKQIADRLGIALITVKVHRGRAMRKLGARSPADLTRIATIAGIRAHA
jgi:FixJ family two-component response regulator